jgi:NodT family efflux transporter outer membrane factor (OMF) lipoprotein
LNINNQNIIAANAQYRQARAIVDEARAGYFPTLSASLSVIRQYQSGSGSFSSSSSSSSSGAVTTTNNQASLNASWEPDIWGSVRRTVEADLSAAQSSEAQLAATRLSAQASLAQYYFELRGVDSDRELLDKTVKDDKKSLQLTLNRFHQGTGSKVDVLQARTQLEDAQALAINLGITRGQYEHAIAVLIGKAPADLSMSYRPFHGLPPLIPAQLPSQLLQRRPDIAAAERTVSQANAQIGVAIAAYFPTLTFTPAAAVQSFSNWFTQPIYSWSIGPVLAETLFDGGLRAATTRAARANYDATVAQYRQTVLSAFQDVEDNLVSLHVLKAQAVVQNQAARDAESTLALVINQYKAGTASYTDVIVQQIIVYNAEKAAVDVTTLRMTSSVGLIKALGGGWNGALLHDN